MNSFINKFNPFQTIAGYNQVDELKNFILPDTCIVTMKDIWELYHNRFPKNIDVYFVHTLEESELEKEIEKFTNYKMIIGFGGGQALDIAKYFSWKCNLFLFQFPTSISVDAVFGHRSGIRRRGNVNYIGWAIPECVFIDYEIIQSAPLIFNYSGIGDVLCFYTGVLDWQFANKKNKCEQKWKYNQELAKQSLKYVDDLLLNIENIKVMNESAIDAIIRAHQWGGNSFFSSGWNPRHIEGIEHFFFYNLEYLTNKKFIHGQPVCLGFVLGCLLHNKLEGKFVNFFKSLDFDFSPNAMNISWNNIDRTLSTLKNYIEKNHLWYGIGNDFEYSKDILEKLKATVDSFN
ncbi:iron-containing alcohol dehydrogenase [Alphaproteobacteria bacterium]|nr:iron-containing alcohol dehydrogenase [Alphaproteobacteria bacterium]